MESRELELRGGMERADPPQWKRWWTGQGQMSEGSSVGGDVGGESGMRIDTLTRTGLRTFLHF